MADGARVTLIDVAEQAGVSRATASLVLRGTGRVSQATRDRVHTAMAELGYVYNRSAAALRTRKSNVVGVLVTTVASPFFAEVVVGLEEELAGAGYVTLIANTLNDVDRQAQLTRFLQETTVGGVVVVPAFDTPADAFADLTRQGIPLVNLSRSIGGVSGHFIGTDDVAGGRAAAEHLIWHGCTDLLYLGGRLDAVARRERLTGVHAAVREHGPAHTVRDIACPTSARGGYAAGLELVAGPLPEAVLCHSDTVAMGLYRALHDAGDADRTRVVSFDDIDGAALFEPPLTSVSGPPGAIGRRAARAMVRAITGETSDEPDLIVPELVIRRSCGC